MFREPFARGLARGGMPWQEMERLRRDLNRMVSTLPNVDWRSAPGYPAMNVWINEESAVVTAELPGVNPEDLDIAVVGDTLTLTGDRAPEELNDGDTYHRRERKCGKFTRAFQLPFHVDGSKVEAVFEKGVLQITLPRAEADKPKKITIKAG